MSRWRPVLTPARRAHLEALADGQPHALRGLGNVGFSCRQLGWCGFAAIDRATGEVMPVQRSMQIAHDGGFVWYTRFKFMGSREIITAEGLRMLGLETPKAAPASQ